MGKPFKSFTPSAWVGVILVIFYTAMVMHIMKKKISGVNNPGVSRAGRYTDLFGRVSYSAAMSFSSGDSQSHFGLGEEVGMPERITTAGFGIFLLIITTAYTANLAAFLVNDYSSQEIPKFSTMEKILGAGSKVCVYSTILPYAAQFLDKGEYEEYGKIREAVKAFDREECDGIILSSFLQQQYIENLCNTVYN